MTTREWRSLEPDVQQIIASHQTAAPVKLSALASALGVKLRASTLPLGISGEIRPDADSESGFAVRVNRHDSSRRQRFTIAHELSHFLLHKDQIGDGITDDVLYRSEISDAREAEANRLAAEILMPRALVSEWVDRARALGVADIPLYLAEQFDVSEAAMKIRLGLS
jgi:hypothetical protein